MARRGWVGVVLVVAFFLLPMVPYEENSFGGTLTAQVSLSFALFNCGIVWHLVSSSPYLSMTFWNNGMWICGSSFGG